MVRTLDAVLYVWRQAQGRPLASGPASSALQLQHHIMICKDMSAQQMQTTLAALHAIMTRTGIIAHLSHYQ